MANLERVRLELPLVLPEVDDPEDPCVGRLINALRLLAYPDAASGHAVKTAAPDGHQAEPSKAAL